MASSKHIDRICLVVTILALLLTVLFMNGRALGIEPIADGDAGNDMFTANDLNGEWDTAGSTEITLTGNGGSVKGSGAYVYDGDVHILYAGKYVLSGELDNGSVIIEAGSSDKIWLLLDGVSLHCDDNAAILVEEAGKVFLTLAEGSENTLSSGAEYTEDALSSGIDGVIYSRDDLTINGSGALTVTAEYWHGIVGNDDLVIVDSKIDITAIQDGIHAHDSARFADVDLTISAGDDGITVKNDDETSYIYIESGNINITSCYEGIEAIDITIAGGTIDIRPTDDGINACGQGSNSAIRITGGDITIINETGRDADGLDSNGDILISGGNTFISVNTSSYALDYGSENGGVCKISGGTVIAAGGSTMAEGFDSSSEQCFIMHTTSNMAAGTAVTLKNAAGDTLVSETIPCGFSSIVISTPEMQMGETCTLTIGDMDAEIVVDNSSDSNGFGMGGMFGGGMRQGGGKFSGGGGKIGRSFDDQRDINSDKTAENEPQDELEMLSISTNRGGTPQMPGGNFTDGDMPQMPGGDFPGGDMPQMPDGDFPGGDMPQMPDGDFSGGDMPQVPDGDFSGGDMPQMPDGDFPSGDMPQMPDGDFTDGDMTQLPEDNFRGEGGMRGNDQFMQGRQDQDTLSETSAVSPNTLIPVGISALALLVGILIAAKVKH